MNTQNNGINTISIQAFYKINADSEVLIPSDKFILNYNVVDELPSVEKVVTIEKEKIVEKPVEKDVEKIVDKIPIWIWVFAILIIAGLIWKNQIKKFIKG